jgi:CRISPR-associated protein Cas2
MNELHLIAYDTPNDKRRRRVAKVLEGYGQRVQDSVFECWLNPLQRAALLHRLRRQLHLRHDTLRVYILCGKDVADVQCFGGGEHPHDPDPPVV